MNKLTQLKFCPMETFEEVMDKMSNEELDALLLEVKKYESSGPSVEEFMQYSELLQSLSDMMSIYNCSYNAPHEQRGVNCFYKAS